MGYQSPGNPTGFVNDFAQVLSIDAKSNLEKILSEFQKNTTNEIAVVTIKTLASDDIVLYANQLFKEWKIGTKENKNGILFLIVINDKKLRIATGSGLEGALPDIVAGSIIRNEVTPLLKENKFDEGITKGVKAIILATENEYEAPKQKTKDFFPLFFLFFIILWQIIISILAPTKSWWLGGVIGGGIGLVFGFILASLLWGAITTIGFTLLGLLIDYIVSKKYRHDKQHPLDTFWGGPHSLGGGSGGGFGGFSGGGTSGGGASGSW